ncbi:MAG: hypothetical protein OXF68_07735 [Gammaproteobacteria bacterium]|nr:hypothetical protein [Gammaproteobacteria bacterium]
MDDLVVAGRVRPIKAGGRSTIRRVGGRRADVGGVGTYLEHNEGPPNRLGRGIDVAEVTAIEIVDVIDYH